MKKLVVFPCFIFFVTFLFYSRCAHAQSMRTESFLNPFFVSAVSADRVTGYVSALRTSPGRTDECKFLFSGKISNLGYGSVDIKNAIPTDGLILNEEPISAMIRINEENKSLVITTRSAPGDCDWILDFFGEPFVKNKNNEFIFTLKGKEFGDWKMIDVIKKNRSYFYSEPLESKKMKSYLVAGDVLYIYNEIPDWYFAKFKGRKGEVSGWIRKTDALK